MARHIALLRGINLGSRNRVRMPELRELLAGDGYDDPRTLVQSGNVVLSSRKPDGPARAALEALIADAFGIESRSWCAPRRARAVIEAIPSTTPSPTRSASR